MLRRESARHATRLFKFIICSPCIPNVISLITTLDRVILSLTRVLGFRTRFHSPIRVLITLNFSPAPINSRRFNCFLIPYNSFLLQQFFTLVLKTWSLANSINKSLIIYQLFIGPPSIIQWGGSISKNLIARNSLFYSNNRPLQAPRTY